MIAIKIKKGTWEDDGVERDLVWEKCSNSECSNFELHYPTYMEIPQCPDCKTALIGNRLRKYPAARINYHLNYHPTTQEL